MTPKPGSSFRHRIAVMSDLPEWRALMEVAIRELVGAILDPPKVEASFEIMGVDTQLIEDGTAFAIEGDGRIVGCGAWSRRAALSLMATVAGEPLYSAYGFTVIERVEVPTSKGVKVPGARMGKPVDTALPSS
jgi:hypothetical protein